MGNERQRILVVVDDRTDRMALEELAGETGFPYDLVPAASVEEAKSILARERWDAVVSDHFLCDDTAFDLFAGIGKETPVVIIAALGDEGTVARAMKAGASGYMVKDPEGRYLATLAATLGHAIRHKRNEIELGEHRGRLEEMVKQRTAGLHREIEERKHCEEAFRQAHHELERRIEGRTIELSRANEQLEREIGECRRAQEAIRVSEERYRILVESSSDAILILDSERRVLSCNQAFLDLFGYGRNEVEGLSIRIIHRSDESFRAFGEKIYPVIKAVGTCRTEWDFVHRDGALFPVETVTSAMRSSDGSIQGYVAIIRDITQRRLMEDALRESETNYRLVIENASDSIIVAQDGVAVFANRKALESTGVTAEELTSRPFTDFIHPDDRKMVYERHMERLRGEGTPGPYPFRILNKKGDSLWVEVNAVLTTWRDRPATLNFLTDITERKRAEQALKASEERYRDLFDNAPVGYHEIDGDGRITRVNRTELDMLGYTAQEMLGRYVWEFIVEDISESQVKGKLAGDSPTGLPFERTYRRKDGAPVPVLIEDRPVRSNEGHIIGIRSTIQDITELKQVRVALLESEAQKRAILDASIDGIRYVDRDMRIIWANKTTALSRNRSPEELVGKTCHKALRGRDTPCIGCPTIRARETGRVERAVLYQPVARGTGGGTYWDSYSVPLKNENGEVAGFVQVARNITAQMRVEEALRESEARYRSLVEQIPAITYTAELDKAGTRVYVSPQIESIIGFTQSECGRDPEIWHKQLHPEDRDRVLAGVARSHETGEPLRMEYRMLHREGHVVWLRDEAVIVKDSTGRPLHLQGIVFDISRAKQAEEQIHILSQELMKAHERERQMISLELHDRVAQDLSTAKIGLDTLLYSQLGAGPETKTQFMELSKILQGSITAVRDLAYDLRPPSLDQLGLVQSIYQYCEEFSEKTGLVVDFTCGGLDDLSLDSDREINLYRLVQEGLINVRKHAEAAHVIVRLVASFPDIILRIMDDGKGFDVEERRQSLTNEKRMGLRSMEERVRWLGGAMDIKSSPGKGTRIVIHLPHKEKEGGPEENPVDRG